MIKILSTWLLNDPNANVGPLSHIQIRAPKTAAYYISPIKIGVF